MANKVIGDYTAAITIDGATHFMLIQPGTSSTAYKKISRNILLGVTGQPADISSVQSLTNKTLDNTNTITLKDTLFTLQDDGDTSKQARFQLSGITTATTRTYTLPNASSTLVDLSTSQTLTNKALTSPAITGGTIDNSTITVDSIAGHSSSTVVTVAGVQMNNGVINTSNAVTSTSIAAGAVQPQALTTGTGTGWAWQSWTPTWTNLTVASSTVVTKYNQTGKTVNFRIVVTLGGGNAPSGSVSFTLPVTAISYGQTSDGFPIIGRVQYEDNGVAGYVGSIRLTSSTLGQLVADNSASTYVQFTALSATVPHAWGNSDEIIVTGSYEAA